MKVDVEVIYIVDDDLVVCDVLFVLFNMEGYVVEIFFDGDVFIKLVSKLVLVCIMLDVYMFGWFGIEILKVLNVENYLVFVFIIFG